MRDKAIPIFVKYLKMAKYANVALTSLGYTQIPQHPKGPPDPALVEAMIDNLITVTPVKKRVPRSYRYAYSKGTGGYRWGYGTRLVWVTEFIQAENPEAKDLLYEYTGQDFGYDKELWRKQILLPLQKQAREPHHREQ
jgi:hypothetical protein